MLDVVSQALFWLYVVVIYLVVWCWIRDGIVSKGYNPSPSPGKQTTTKQQPAAAKSKNKATKTEQQGWQR